MKVQIFLGFACGFFGLLANSAALAGDHSDTQAGLAAFGARETINWSTTPVQAKIVIDETKVLANFQQLKDAGIINPDVTQTFVNANPHALSSVVAHQMATMDVMDAYQNSAIDKARFAVFVAVSDDYGQKIERPVFSFDFDRRTFKRINWDNFNMANLPKVAPHFRYSTWAVQNTLGDDQ